jgi:hypothetical protein
MMGRAKRYPSRYSPVQEMGLAPLDPSYDFAPTFDLANRFSNRNASPRSG